MSNININTLFTNQTVAIIKKDNSFCDMIRIVSAVDLFGISFYDSMEQPKFLSYEELKEYDIVRSITTDNFLRMSETINEINATSKRIQDDKVILESLDRRMESFTSHDYAPFNINMIADPQKIVTVKGGHLQYLDKEIRGRLIAGGVSSFHPVVILENYSNDTARIGTFICGKWFEFALRIRQSSLIPFEVTKDTMFFKRENQIQTSVVGDEINMFKTTKQFNPDTGYLV